MKNILTCPTDAQFARALSDDDDSRFRDHFVICDTCQKHWEEQQAIREMLRLSERDTLKAEHVAAMRANLLGEALLASERQRFRIRCPRTMVRVIAAAVAILGLAILFYSGIPQNSMFQSAIPARVAKGIVHGDSTCDFVHFHNEPDEIVRLKDGNITVSVDKLNSGERFRVITGDAEVEVRGTAFDVAAKDDALVSVKVHSGRVEVRTGQHIHRLDAGDRWKRMDTPLWVEPSAPPNEASSHEYPEPLNRPNVSDAPKTGAVSLPPKSKQHAKRFALSEDKDAPTTPSLSKSAAEDMFIEGFDAFKRGAFRRAAKQFEKALVLEGHHTIAADASFWRAAALAKANNGVSARAALKDFLEKFPASPRVKEASVILGWQVLSSNPSAAKDYFEAGKDAADPKIRKSAAKGIDAVKEMLVKTD